MFSFRSSIGKQTSFRSLFRIAIIVATEQAASCVKLIKLAQERVHAVDETAASFYERFGLRALSSTPQTLMVSLATLRAAGYR